ncbi:MAG: carboxypeptidase regulatory-like domain-containing protein [Deltaproteobacteria bacterium]|nr:carboxypeptidase regulatory-like domain-containing protein [Deltaproteobacteria bacterium]
MGGRLLAEYIDPILNEDKTIMIRNAVFFKWALSILFSFILLALSSMSGNIQLFAEVITLTDGDWSRQYETLYYTSEADLMVRVGDIDNLGFGWPIGFNPFTGETTLCHEPSWSDDPNALNGTDKIMVVTSFNDAPPNDKDAYTRETSRPENNVQSINLNYDLKCVTINSALLQLFVDDFQPSIFLALYQVSLDGVRFPPLENIINSLLQSGCSGQLITAEIPDEYLDLLRDGNSSIRIDDLTTGAGEGFAIDFVKLLINPKTISHSGSIDGIVTDAQTMFPIEGATVFLEGMPEAAVFTDNSGYYSFSNVPAGVVAISGFKEEYAKKVKSTNLESGQTVTVNFSLDASSLDISPPSHDFKNIIVDSNSPIQRFTITNISGTGVIIQDVAIIGIGADKFIIQGDSCLESVLSPSDTCSFDVSFAPSVKGVSNVQIALAATFQNTKKSFYRYIPLKGTGVINQIKNLNATVINGSQIDLTWEDLCLNELGFEILRCDNCGDPNQISAYDLIGCVDPNVIFHSDLYCNEGDLYHYVVRAIIPTDYENTSIYSNRVEITPGCNVPPSDLTAEVISENIVILNWVDHSSCESGFIVLRRQEGDPSYLQINGPLPPDTISYLDTTVESKTKYYYYIKTLSFTDESLPSNEVVVITTKSGIDSPDCSDCSDDGSCSNCLNCFISIIGKFPGLGLRK